jgi:DNA helicase HerA-like ATPase
MQELKDEIARYVEEELKYDGEVAGNVKTAIKVRLENLCGGAKGFTFNTNEYLDFATLLEKNVVVELEGLADDSDKAFSVGLLVIFINEYRQIAKEISGNQKTELKHLLVIEEAHRLLKNVDTERTTETSGNPKGKAVEHFTNMIAEMRAYGQGVIVAEQIPTKLAPDIIKKLVD